MGPILKKKRDTRLLKLQSAISLLISGCIFFATSPVFGEEASPNPGDLNKKKDFDGRVQDAMPPGSESSIAFYSDNDEYFVHVLETFAARPELPEAILAQIDVTYHRTHSYQVKQAIIYSLRGHYNQTEALSLWFESLVEGLYTVDSGASQVDRLGSPVEVRRVAAAVMGDHVAKNSFDEPTLERIGRWLLERVKSDPNEGVSSAAVISLGSTINLLPEGRSKQNLLSDLNRFFADLPLNRDNLAYAAALAMGDIADLSSFFSLFDSRFRAFSQKVHQQVFLSLQKISSQEPKKTVKSAQ